MHITIIILRVADLDRSTAFFRDVIGLQVEDEIPGFVFFQAGSVRIGLNQASAEHAGAKGSLAEIVLDVADIDASHDRMQAAGVTFRMAPMIVSSNDESDLYAAAFHDPDGHLFSIAERRLK